MNNCILKGNSNHKNNDNRKHIESLLIEVNTITIKK